VLANARRHRAWGTVLVANAARSGERRAERSARCARSHRAWGGTLQGVAREKLLKIHPVDAFAVSFKSVVETKNILREMV
jgi:hypothetical protein